MVSNFTVFCISVTAVICLALPTILAIVMIVKYKASWKAFVLGAAVFAVFQLFTRIQILAFLQNDAGFILFTQTSTVVYIILLALSAGVFEEAGRFLGMRFFMQKGLTWKNGIVFGLGHGGIEAFVLVGLNYLFMLINLTDQSTAAVIAQTPSYMFLVAGLERILTIAVHIGMTLLVLYSVKYKRISYLLYAIAFHTAVDCVALLSLPFGSNVWISEGYVAVFAVLSILMIVKFKPLIDHNEDLITKWRF